MLLGTFRGADFGEINEQAMCHVWEGRGMQGVPWCLALGGQVWFQGSPPGICGVQSDTEANFLPDISACLLVSC